MNYDGFTADKKTLSSKKRLKWHLRVYLANLKIVQNVFTSDTFFAFFVEGSPLPTGDNGSIIVRLNVPDFPTKSTN